MRNEKWYLPQDRLFLKRMLLTAFIFHSSFLTSYFSFRSISAVADPRGAELRESLR